MHPHEPPRLLLTRRHFFGRSATGIGIAALASLLNRDLGQAAEARPGILRTPHHPPRAKRVIYLFMSGGPSHIDLFDYKPQLRNHQSPLPAARFRPAAHQRPALDAGSVGRSPRPSLLNLRPISCAVAHSWVDSTWPEPLAPD